MFLLWSVFLSACAYRPACYDSHLKELILLTARVCVGGEKARATAHTIIAHTPRDLTNMCLLPPPAHQGDIHEVEIIGGGVRIPQLQTMLKAVFEDRLPLAVHLNGDEAAALGTHSTATLD